MPGRNLRIVKREKALTLGVCEACNKQFRSHIHPRSQSEWEIKVLFERHKCKMPAEPAVNHGAHRVTVPEQKGQRGLDILLRKSVLMAEKAEPV